MGLIHDIVVVFYPEAFEGFCSYKRRDEMKNSLTVPMHLDIVITGIILVLGAGIFGFQGVGSFLAGILGAGTFGLLGTLVAHMPLVAARYDMTHKDRAELGTRLFSVYAIASIASYLVGAGLGIIF